MGRPPASGPPPPRPPSAARPPTKCTECGILLDVPCTNPGCDGHGNARQGDVCGYCATNARTTHTLGRPPTSPLASTLDDIGYGRIKTETRGRGPTITRGGTGGGSPPSVGPVLGDGYTRGEKSRPAHEDRKAMQKGISELKSLGLP